MRTSFLLTSLALILGACSDEQRPTAPVNSRAAATTYATDVLPTGQGIKLPDAKPVDQVGFTKVLTVVGSSVDVQNGDGRKTATATCPVGSTAVGGSYIISNFLQARSFIYDYSGLDNANGWSVTGMVLDAGALVTFSASATCLQ
jgi:hypothetical protein